MFRHFHFIFHFYWFIQIFTILFSHCPQIAKASLGGQCLYKTKYATPNGIILNCKKDQQRLFKLIAFDEGERILFESFFRGISHEYGYPASVVLDAMRFHGLDAILDRPGTFFLDLMLVRGDLVFTRSLAVKLRVSGD